MKPDWIIFYDDGTQVSSDEMDIFDVPRRGVEIVVQKEERTGYRMWFSTGDYFVYDPDRGGWRLTDNFGMWDYLVVVRQPVVLFGRNMKDSEFWALEQRVRELCGEKQGWLQSERRIKQA